MSPMPIPAEHYNLYQLFKDIGDLVTATSNPALGKATDTEKTLGEVQIVQGASNMIFEEVAAQVARDGWARLWDQVRWLIGQYGQGGSVRYRKTAAPGRFLLDEVNGEVPAALMMGQLVPAPGGTAFGNVPSSILLADVDLVPAGLRKLSDMSSRVSQATLVQNLLLNHPLTADNIPVLILALDEYLQSLSYAKREEVIAEIQRRLDVENALMMQQMQQEQMMAEQARQDLAAPQQAASSPAGEPVPTNPAMEVGEPQPLEGAAV
jgi:hypothetical protein